MKHRYTADAGASGADVFTFTATDLFGAISAPATVNVTIAPCTTASFDYTRAMQVWYGSAFQGATTLRDGLQLSDFISFGVKSYIQQVPPIPDPRVVAGVGAWVNPPNLTNTDWVLGTPQNQPAEDRLRTVLAAGLAAPSFDPVVNRGKGPTFGLPKPFLRSCSA